MEDATMVRAAVLSVGRHHPLAAFSPWLAGALWSYGHHSDPVGSPLGYCQDDGFPWRVHFGPSPLFFWSGPILSFLLYLPPWVHFVPSWRFPLLGSRSPQGWFIFPIQFFLNLPQPGDSCQHECKRHQIYQLRFSPTRKECCSTQDCQCPSKVAS